ncbi:MAG: hypothetical protein J6K42_05240 [Clostridia bacterium]|nr:hypothetical protein [Clostridia bacterium]
MIRNNIDVIIKCIFINMFAIMIFIKITNYTKFKLVKKIEIMVSIFALALLYMYFRTILDIIMSVIIVCLIQAILLKFITEIKLFNILIGVIIANSISYILFVISGTLEFFVQRILNINNITINLVLTALVEWILIHYLLMIKRLKNGLGFLQKTNEYMEIAVINISMILVLVYGLISYNNEQIYKYLYFYYIILGIFMILIVQKTIVMYYKQKLIDDTINQYKQDIQEKDMEIKRLTDEVFKVSKINHEFYNRQKSLEQMVKEKSKNLGMEAGEELDVLNRIKELTYEHSEKMKEIKSLQALQLTDIPEIDDMLAYMQKECEKSNIQFKLNVNGNIHFLINNFIPKNKLETLIGDHIRDAIIAINFSNNVNKEIFVILGIKVDCYELCIYDTGIEFEIDTLLKLGLVPATTHKDTGGSGIGFMTTFETLKECKASLIIEEKNPLNNKDYTKAVKVRFDGKNEYKICSYRSEDIIKKCKDNRITIQAL